MAHRPHIGFEDARSIVRDTLSPLSPLEVSIFDASELIAHEDMVARVDCPSLSSSMKDGFAVVSIDLTDAREDAPKRLSVTGMLAAGRRSPLKVRSGTTVRIMTGAPLPEGADAVLSEEYARVEGETILCLREAEAGRNVLFRGSDVRMGEPVVRKGQFLAPAVTGFMAAAGIDRAWVVPLPKVGVVATGAEVVMPGCSLRPGELYASNLITLICWLKHFRMKTRFASAPDREADIRAAIESVVRDVDVLLTSGGAWRSERDLTVRVLEEMGWNPLFRGVRMGPGKAVTFGLLDGIPVFCLPGGPPSNEMAFLQIVLPGLMIMGARPKAPFRDEVVRLADRVTGDKTWTQFIYADLVEREGERWAAPLRLKSRLRSQACARAVIRIQEGRESIEEGSAVSVQILGEPQA
ncbi:MAG: molybdopterin molybdotransferase MoeA [Deltaproteobacteria bacterium]|nr:molybdopterin molybdotransferase MoeA [Deltaproteobacteria bacterium]